MNEMGYVSQQEVEQILAWNLAIDAEQKAIETFKVQWQATQQHHKSLSEERRACAMMLRYTSNFWRI
jgi:ornithine cyclodeaminase/alanine dehydrogenase-like protein (mu-crystallin family)